MAWYDKYEQPTKKKEEEQGWWSRYDTAPIAPTTPVEQPSQPVSQPTPATAKPGLASRIFTTAKKVGGLLVEDITKYGKGVKHAFNPTRVANLIMSRSSDPTYREYGQKELLKDKKAPVTPKEMLISTAGTALDVGTFGVGTSLIKGGAKVGTKAGIKAGVKEVLKGMVSKRALPAVGIGAGYGALASAREGTAKTLPRNVLLGAGLALGGQAGVEIAGVGAGKILSKFRKPKIGIAAKPSTMPVDNLISHEGAPDITQVNKFKEKISSGQSIEPIKIIPESNGKFGIEDGKHRFQAYKELGYKEVPVEMVPSKAKLPVKPVEVIPGVKPKAELPEVVIKPKAVEIKPAITKELQPLAQETKLTDIKQYKETINLVQDAISSGDIPAAKSIYEGIPKSRYLPKFEEVLSKSKQKQFAGALEEQMAGQAGKYETLTAEREMFDATIGSETVDNVKRIMRSKLGQRSDFDVTKIKGFDEIADEVRSMKNNPDLSSSDVLDMIGKLPSKTEVAAVKPIQIKRPKELEVISPEKAEEMIQTNLKGGEVTKVPSTQLPVGEGREKVSRLEARIKGKLGAVSEEERTSLSTFNEMNKLSQIKKTAQYVSDNPNEAMRVLEGRKQPPEGILYNSIVVAMEEKAVSDGNVDLALKLASLRSTRAGQEIGILTELNKNNPVRYIDDLIKRRVEALGGKEKITISRTKAQGELTNVIRTSAPQKNEWLKFVTSIKC